MNWEAIGVIAEIIAAIAVVVSLVYLGIQVRHTADLSVASTSSHVLTEFNRMQEAMLSNPQIAELFGKLNSGVKLNAAEDALLEILLRRYLIHWYDAQIGYDRKLVDDTIYEAHCEDVKRMIKRYPICHRMCRDILVDYSSPHAMRILDPIFQQEPELS